MVDHPKKHLTLIKIEKSNAVNSICMPEGELVGPYHQCVSIELNKFNAEHYINTETVSQVRSGCNSFKKSFEQQKRSFGSLPEVFCTGKVSFDARCKIEEGSRRVLMCKRCDSCSWFMAGLQKFSATCPSMVNDQQQVRGYHVIENVEHWIRESAPYNYAHRSRVCSPNTCCDKLQVKINGFERLFSFKNGVYSDQSGGVTMRRNDNPIFQGWQLEQYGNSGTFISSLTSSRQTCPVDTVTWIDQSNGVEKNVQVRCQADQTKSVWSEWGNWVECSCRFRATYRERTCNGTDCNGHSVETKPCEKKLSCSNCCGEIEVKLPNVDEFRRSSELTSVDTTFYLTEHQDKGKPIYEAKNGQSYLRPYINMYWIITKDVRSADFIYFNEDSSICPTYANQLKWNYKSGSSQDFHFELDNRIQFVCKQTKVKKVSNESNGVTTTKPIVTTVQPQSMAKTENGCCSSLKVYIPRDKTPGDYAGTYMYDSSGKFYANTNSVRTMLKVGSFWALAQDKDTAKYKLYHASNVDCPENASADGWKILHNGNWVVDADIRVTCSAPVVTTTSATTTKPTTIVTTTATTTVAEKGGSCCDTIIIDRGDGIPVKLDKSASKERGWISSITKNTFAFQDKYAMFGFDYSISRVACYTTLKTADPICPSQIVASWKCLDGSWTTAPSFSIKCAVRPTQAPTTVATVARTTKVTTTKKTTTTTTTTTTRRIVSLGTTPKPTTTQRVTIANTGKTAEGCCTRLSLRNHGVSTIPSVYKLKVNNDEDTKWFNSDHTYTMHWEVKSNTNYWIFGQGYDIGKVKCYVSLKANDIQTSNCPETVKKWTCFTPGKGWVESPFSVECDEYTNKQVLPQIQAPKRPEVSRPNTTPKVTTPTSTPKTTTSTIKIVAQKRNKDGCCSILQSVWPKSDPHYDNKVVGKYRKIFGFYRKDNDRRVELKLMETYFAILVNGNNRIYATNNQNGEKVKCPEDIKSWQLYDGANWFSTNFELNCPSLADANEYTNENDADDYEDYNLIELTTTAATTTTEWTTTPWSTIEATAEPNDVQVWAPWSSCSSTCRGIQTRSTFDASSPSQVRPCGNACAQLSSWFEWSPCSAWCGMGKQTRRRLCVKDQRLSNECQEPKQDRFDEKTCYIKPCPMSDPKNCCQAITLKSSTPSPFVGTYFITNSDSKSVKYKHTDNEYYVYKANHKWKVGLSDQSVSPFTIFGTRGRGHCPVPISKWSPIEVGQSGNRVIGVECGSSWSEWSDTMTDNKTQCGDRLQKRRRIDNYGLTSEETRNIGEPCAACGLDNKSDECETYAASGYCHNQHFAQFMIENCPRTCCVYTGNYSFV